MNSNIKMQKRVSYLRGGQTLVIALIILGVLLLLGFVFIGFISRNITSQGIGTNQSIGSQLAQEGVEYVHNQMLTSPLGADWRGTLTPMNVLPGGITHDPDAYYLRPGSGLAYRADDPTQVDLGGPDGLGFYTRVNSVLGRELVRVRYAPSDANIYSARPTGLLREPGKARDYLIIEVIGRPGVVNPNDPTSAGAGAGVKVNSYTGSADLQANLASMANADKTFITSKKVVAFASIGVIESALYITNKDRTTRPADIGVSNTLGATYAGIPVTVAQNMGDILPMYNLGIPPTATVGGIGVGGSIYSNADVLVHGNLNLALNSTLGDGFDVNGTIQGASSTSSLTITRNEYFPNRPGFPAGWYGDFPATKPANTPSLAMSGAGLNSNGNFNTLGGVLRDGINQTDASGFARGIGYKAPPVIESQDPQSGSNRYLDLTKNSGSQLGIGNSGEFGYGQGVYVDNSADVQLANSALDRAVSGTNSSLEYDWLNPNNGRTKGSGWFGPFYVPVGAFLSLQSDGFIISRDSTDPKSAFWKNPDGSAPGTPFTSIRYRLGRGTDGQVHIVNTLTPGIGDINGVGLNFGLGPIFNGVLYFDGNVRVRGVIPTDVQLTVVSNANIYIEGSITKGIVGSDVATDAARGLLISRPSRSSCMLMANDYVVLNTTQFFGTGTSPFNVDAAGTTAVGTTPAVLKTVGDTLSLEHEFLLNPNPVNPTTPATDPFSPSTWQPYDTNYTPVGSTAKMSTILLLSHSMDPNNSAASFVSMAVNFGLGTSKYLFPLISSNAATATLGAGYTEPGYTNAGYASIYGLGATNWQQYAHFETISLPLITNNFTYNAGTNSLTGQPANVSGTYSIAEQEANFFNIQLNNLGASPTSQYYFAKAASVPADIRIEAGIYAENGSFFVIPGTWFNPSVNDSRSAYLADVSQYVGQGYPLANAQTLANTDRLNNYGSYPDSPFYGEPIDARISIFGSVSENMPPPESEQVAWEQKWGWIPVAQGSGGREIPAEHFGGQPNTVQYVPNLTISYDPVLATGRVKGFVPTNAPGTNDPYLRTDGYGRPLPPMPRLPVSPTLAYFGDEQF